MQRTFLLIGAIAVVVIVIAAAVLLVSGGSTNISGPTTMTLKSTPVVIKSGGSEYVLSLHGSSGANGTAYVYIVKSPVLQNTAENVTLLLGNYTRVNLGTSYANIEIKLDSVNGTAAKITLDPLQAYLDVTPDFSRIHAVAQASSNFTTTVIQVTTTSSTSTIYNQTKAAYTRIQSYLEESDWYGLMANYTTYYENSKNCSPALYNGTYIRMQLTAPVPPFDYWNATVFTPYDLTYNISNVGNGSYAVTYSTVSASAETTGPALVLIMNLTTGEITNTTLSGPFKDLSFSSLQSLASEVVAAGNSCGIEII